MSEQDEELGRLKEESASYPSEAPVTVAIFAEPVSANMARMVLDSAGIRSFLQGENANSLIPPAFSAQLQVRPEDEEAAREVLSSLDTAPESMEDVTAAEVAGERGKGSAG